MTTDRWCNNCAHNGDKKTCARCWRANPMSKMLDYKDLWRPDDKWTRDHECSSCKYRSLSASEEPCDACTYQDAWEPVDEQDEYFTERPDHLSKKVINGKTYLHDGCDGCKYMDLPDGEVPCIGCKSAHLAEEAKYYDDVWTPADDGSDWTESKNQDAKADAGKAQLTMVPRRIIWDIARVRMYGNRKYGDPENWRTVSKERYRDAAFRHFLAYLDDPDGVDEESGIKHLHHLACNIAFLCEMEDNDDD